MRIVYLENNIIQDLNLSLTDYNTFDESSLGTFKVANSFAQNYRDQFGTLDIQKLWNTHAKLVITYILGRYATLRQFEWRLLLTQDKLILKKAIYKGINKLTINRELWPLLMPLTFQNAVGSYGIPTTSIGDIFSALGPYVEPELINAGLEKYKIIGEAWCGQLLKDADGVNQYIYTWDYREFKHDLGTFETWADFVASAPTVGTFDKVTIKSQGMALSYRFDGDDITQWQDMGNWTGITLTKIKNKFYLVKENFVLAGSEGEQGPIGPQGPQGVQGPQGIQGPVGPAGPLPPDERLFDATSTTTGKFLRDKEIAIDSNTDNTKIELAHTGLVASNDFGQKEGSYSWEGLFIANDAVSPTQQIELHANNIEYYENSALVVEQTWPDLLSGKVVDIPNLVSANTGNALTVSATPEGKLFVATPAAVNENQLFDASSTNDIRILENKKIGISAPIPSTDHTTLDITGLELETFNTSASNFDILKIGANAVNYSPDGGSNTITSPWPDLINNAELPIYMVKNNQYLQLWPSTTSIHEFSVLFSQTTNNLSIFAEFWKSGGTTNVTVRIYDGSGMQFSQDYTSWFHGQFDVAHDTGGNASYYIRNRSIEPMVVYVQSYAATSTQRVKDLITLHDGALPTTATNNVPIQTFPVMLIHAIGPNRFFELPPAGNTSQNKFSTAGGSIIVADTAALANTSTVSPTSVTIGNTTPGSSAVLTANDVTHTPTTGGTAITATWDTIIKHANNGVIAGLTNGLNDAVPWPTTRTVKEAWEDIRNYMVAQKASILLVEDNNADRNNFLLGIATNYPTDFLHEQVSWMITHDGATDGSYLANLQIWAYGKAEDKFAEGLIRGYDWSASFFFKSFNPWTDITATVATRVWTAEDIGKQLRLTLDSDGAFLMEIVRFSGTDVHATGSYSNSFGATSLVKTEIQWDSSSPTTANHAIVTYVPSPTSVASFTTQTVHQILIKD